jgi:RNA polymerase sigma factor (sigma-70 family)
MSLEEPFRDETGHASFKTTHWTTVLQAARPGSSDATEAFAQLYRRYWPPLYAYVRRRGFTPAEAEDLTQSFFARLLEKNTLAGVEREGGRFRSYLLGGLKHFLANEWDRSQARKRGAGEAPVSLNSEEGEALFHSIPDTSGTPESIFERQWVLTLLAGVMRRLQEETAEAKAAFFEEARAHLQGTGAPKPYAEIAALHGLSEGAVKVAVHRLRHRYGELLREEIARTVGSPEEVDGELRYLISLVTD